MHEKVQGSDHAPIFTWAPANEVEHGAMEQLRNVARLPWVFSHVAAMPDVHWGVKGFFAGWDKYKRAEWLDNVAGWAMSLYLSQDGRL